MKKAEKVVACIIARTVSTRLPLKVLRDFKPHFSMLDFLIQRVKSESTIDKVYLCTSNEVVDDILEDVAIRNGIDIYRGSADKVIERMLSVGEIESADILIRITGDNPFTAVELIPNQVEFLKENLLDYVRISGLPVGATSEVFTNDALIECNQIMDPKYSEYLMVYMFEPKNFETGIIKFLSDDFSEYSLTVDTPDDFQRSKLILDHVTADGPIQNVSITSIIKVLSDEAIDLPARRFRKGEIVKMPGGKTISFDDFQIDMERRINDSKVLKLYE